jgi:hypothetical protein
MLTAEARRLAEKHGKPAVVGNNEWSPIWENNPYISKTGDGPKTSSSIGRRPYLKGWDHERLYYDENYRAERGELYFSPEEIDYRDNLGDVGILIEPHVKGTFGGNKAWVWDRWIEIAKSLKVSQCLPPGKRPLPNARIVQTPTIRHALAALSGARLLISTDGALHHAAAALGVPSIVIWGARTDPNVLGYTDHINLTSGDDFCGMMAPCSHCVKAMKAITVDQVLDAAERILDRGAVESNRPVLC